MSEVPTLQDELDRKAIETAQMIQHQYKTGQMTKAMYDAAVLSLWWVTAGLIDNDVSAAVSAMSAEASPEQWTYCPMVKGADLVVLSFSTKGQFRFMRGGRSESKDFADGKEDVVSPSLAARKHFGTVFNLLTDKGFAKA